MTPSPTPPAEPTEVRFVALDLSPEDLDEHELYLAIEMSDGTYSKVVPTGITSGCGYISGWVPGDPADYFIIESMQPNTCEDVAGMLMAIHAIETRPEITGTIECNIVQDQCAISEGNINSTLKLQARTIELPLSFTVRIGETMDRVSFDELEIIGLPRS